MATYSKSFIGSYGRFLRIWGDTVNAPSEVIMSV
jgi:hypothetical protein